MASILNGLAEKAKSLWNGGSALNRTTKIYDASTNKITIARIDIDGVEEAIVSQRSVTVADFGTDPSYYTYYDKEDTMTLTVTILPTASSNALIQALAKKQKELKGWFYISVYENGEIVDIFRSHILALPETNLSQQAPSKVYTFGIKSTLNSNVFVSEQKTKTATGSTKSDANNKLESQGVDENTPIN